MNIRLASDKDYDVVMSLMRQLNPEDPELDGLLGMQRYSSILETSGLSIYLAEIDGEPVATCYLNVIPNLTRGGRPYALIENVVTDKNLRRSGIGTSLLKEVISEAFKLDCYKVMLLTGRDSNVHTFYENCGLEKNRKTAFIKRSAVE
jgi:N-acetylglutamate synthase-like GNAT family acetyltransferase